MSNRQLTPAEIKQFQAMMQALMNSGTEPTTKGHTMSNEVDTKLLTAHIDAFKQRVVNAAAIVIKAFPSEQHARVIQDLQSHVPLFQPADIEAIRAKAATG